MNRIFARGRAAAAASLLPFAGSRRGAVTLEAALAISVLVIAFAGLAEIVRASYVGDMMGRAAWAAARAVALTPDAAADGAQAACAAIRRELDLADDFDCANRWTLTVETGLAPSALLDAAGTGAGTGSGAGGGGEMILVRLA